MLFPKRLRNYKPTLSLDGVFHLVFPSLICVDYIGLSSFGHIEGGANGQFFLKTISSDAVCKCTWSAYRYLFPYRRRKNDRAVGQSLVYNTAPTLRSRYDNKHGECGWFGR